MPLYATKSTRNDACHVIEPRSSWDEHAQAPPNLLENTSDLLIYTACLVRGDSALSSIAFRPNQTTLVGVVLVVTFALSVQNPSRNVIGETYGDGSSSSERNQGEASHQQRA